jgi:sirohydrochlorin cobaltochelatase
MDPSNFPPRPGSALLLLGHGSTVNPDSSSPTLDHAAELRRLGLFGEVVCSFWKEEPGYRQVLDMLESPDIYVVPNFISEGYFTQKIIPRELGLAGEITHLPAIPSLPARTLKYCEPVGSHAGMTRLLLHRASEVAPDVDSKSAALVIVGHGTSLNENSGLAVKKQVELIQQTGRFAEVLGMFMEEEPFVTDWQKLTTAPEVIVVPFFVSDGLHSYQDIPVLLGIETETGPALATAKRSEAESRNEVFRRNPYRIGNRRLYYSSAIGTDPLFTEVILDQVLHFDASHPVLSSTAT